jgi:hypothetical protein
MCEYEGECVECGQKFRDAGWEAQRCRKCGKLVCYPPDGDIHFNGCMKKHRCKCK